MQTTIKAWCEEIRNKPSRVAVPIMTHPGIELTGATVLDAVTKGQVHYEAIRALHDRYPAAAVTMIMDLTVEAETLGAKINFEKDNIPAVSERLINQMEEVDALIVPEPESSPRLAEYLKAARLALENIKDVPVFPGCIGPFSLAGRLLDMTEIMTAIYLYPDVIHQLLGKCSLFILNYVKAYKALGAHGVIMAEPAAGLLGEDDCDQFSSSYIKRIIDEVQDDRFMVVLHNCGHHGILARSMVSTGANALHLGNAADMGMVLDEVPSDILVMGNIDPVNILKTQAPEVVREKTMALLLQSKGHDNFVLSSGCDMPPGVPLENIAAFFKALDDFNAVK